MSIALERNNSALDQSMKRPDFGHRNMTCASSIYNSLDFSLVEEEDRSASLSSSSTSSIGKNSDDESSGGGEVQSGCNKEGALDSLDALEQVLPVKYVFFFFFFFCSRCLFYLILEIKLFR